MAHKLEKALLERVIAGISKKTVTKCSEYAKKYRVMGGETPGPFNFNEAPWTLEPHDSTTEKNVSRKAAQMGFTETALNIVFFQMDIHRRDCLYVLPARTPDAKDFTASRFNPAIELSEHFNKLFSNVSNIGHKQAGTVNLYIRGSRSKSALKSIPVGITIFDEVNEMTQKNIPLAEERMSGQYIKYDWKISTPTVHSFGITKYWEESTKEHYHFKCPKCGKWTFFIYPDCLVITAEDINDPRVKDSYLQCKECKGKLEHEKKKEYINLENCKYVAEYPDRDIRGFTISQMYSFKITPQALAISFLRGLYDPADEQEFYNSKLGIEHEPEGSRINDAQIEKCIKNHSSNDPIPTGRIITMGVDVGKWIHYEIDEWIIPQFGAELNMYARCKLLKEGKVSSFEEIETLLKEYQPRMTVIDANPERRKAYELAMKYPGHIKLCQYTRGVNSRDINNDKSVVISVNRTSWMDLALGRFGSETIQLPRDLSQEYKDRIKIPVKLYDKDADGNPVAKYVGEGDHCAHTRVYAEVALPFAASAATNSNIESFL
jgi:hypothetical protein